MFMKEPHTALFVSPAGVGKTHLTLNLLEKEYKDYFDFINNLSQVKAQRNGQRPKMGLD